MLRIPFIRHGLNLADLTCDEALHDVPACAASRASIRDDASQRPMPPDPGQPSLQPKSKRLDRGQLECVRRPSIPGESVAGLSACRAQSENDTCVKSKLRLTPHTNAAPESASNPITFDNLSIVRRRTYLTAAGAI